MDREEILQASRNENKNRDLAELEMIHRARSHASGVGALACCLISLLSSTVAHLVLYSPWIIYFSMMATQWLFRFIKIKRKSDLLLAILFGVLTILAFIGFAYRLSEVSV